MSRPSNPFIFLLVACSRLLARILGLTARRVVDSKTWRDFFFFHALVSWSGITHGKTLMISVESKTFEFGVMRMVGLNKSGIINMIIL